MRVGRRRKGRRHRDLARREPPHRVRRRAVRHQARPAPILPPVLPRRLLHRPQHLQGQGGRVAAVGHPLLDRLQEHRRRVRRRRLQDRRAGRPPGRRAGAVPRVRGAGVGAVPVLLCRRRAVPGRRALPRGGHRVRLPRRRDPRRPRAAPAARAPRAAHGQGRGGAGGAREHQRGGLLRAGQRGQGLHLPRAPERPLREEQGRRSRPGVGGRVPGPLQGGGRFRRRRLLGAPRGRPRLRRRAPRAPRPARRPREGRHGFALQPRRRPAGVRPRRPGPAPAQPAPP
mmetsp:Transcript_1398/g.2916  ORF Transcript_1398/g.2916 Transcript_1398/m.2916 type:complete len:285 (-) Transcript_1398:462-1316(-)